MSTDIRILCPCTSARSYKLCRGDKSNSCMCVCVCGSMRTCVTDAVYDRPFWEPTVEACSSCFSGDVRMRLSAARTAERWASAPPWSPSPTGTVHTSWASTSWDALTAWSADASSWTESYSSCACEPEQQKEKEENQGSRHNEDVLAGLSHQELFINNLANDPYHNTNHIITFLWAQRRLDSSFEMWNSHTLHAGRKHIKAPLTTPTGCNTLEPRIQTCWSDWNISACTRLINLWLRTFIHHAKRIRYCGSDTNVPLKVNSNNCVYPLTQILGHRVNIFHFQTVHFLSQSCKINDIPMRLGFAFSKH